MKTLIGSPHLVYCPEYNHLQENSFLTSLQSGFMPGDSTANQLAFLYNIYLAKLLMQTKKSGLSFVTLTRHLIVSGMLVYYVNSKLLVSLGNFLIG